MEPEVKFQDGMLTFCTFRCRKYRGVVPVVDVCVSANGSHQCHKAKLKGIVITVYQTLDFFPQMSLSINSSHKLLLRMVVLVWGLVVQKRQTWPVVVFYSP